MDFKDVNVIFNTVDTIKNNARLDAIEKELGMSNKKSRSYSKSSSKVHSGLMNFSVIFVIALIAFGFFYSLTFLF